MKRHADSDPAPFHAVRLFSSMVKNDSFDEFLTRLPTNSYLDD